MPLNLQKVTSTHFCLPQVSKSYPSKPKIFRDERLVVVFGLEHWDFQPKAQLNGLRASMAGRAPNKSIRIVKL